MKMIAVLMFLLSVSFCGFAQLKDTLLNQAPAKGRIANGDSTLHTVTVTAKTPLVKQEADRIIYDLQADAQSKVSSVLDMMRKVPYLSVDGEENVLLKGSPAYKVFINGRPSGLMERNPKEVLRSMPASTIKSIEVIINPPAKYDAEGLAGIINIVTIRQAYDGYKGVANVSKKGPVGGPGAGSSFTLKQAKYDVSAMAGFSRYKVPETSRELTRTTTGTDSTSLHQLVVSRNNGYTAYLGTELSFEYDSLNLISGQFNWSTNKSDGLSEQTTASTGANFQQYYLKNNNNNSDEGMDASVNYQRGSKANKDQLLTFSYRYLSDNSSLYNNALLSNQINFTTPDYRQHSSEKLTEHTAQADYVQPIKKLTIEGGIKGIFRTNEMDFQYHNLNPATGEYEPDPARSNIFHYGQHVLAAYNSYAYQWSKWQIKCGIRLEQTMIKATYSQGVAQIEHNYLNLLPAIVANRKLKDNSSVSFSWCKRIQRPTIAELNPFIDRSDPNFESGGNPYLLPITSDVCQVSYLRSAKATLNISLGGMFFNNVFSAIPSYDSATNITLARYENYGKGRVLKANIYISYPITSQCTFTLNSDIRHVTVNGVAGNNIVIKNSGLGVYANISGGYSFKKGWRANTDVTFNKGGISLPMGRTNGFTASSFSVHKSAIRSKLTISAAISNPFTKYRYINETITGANFLQTSSNQSWYRRFSVSLNYRFGALKEEIRKNKRGINNDDTGGAN